MKTEPDPPATLGSTAEIHLRLIMWCEACRHQVEPDPAEMAERYGAEMTEVTTGIPAVDLIQSVEGRGGHRAGVEKASGVLAVRQPRCRHGGERDKAALVFSRRDRTRLSRSSRTLRPMSSPSS